MIAKLCFIIPNFNGIRHLEYSLRCLDLCAGPDTKIILVDDASTDKSTDFVGNAYPSVEIIRRDRNGGFAASVNTGIRWAAERGFPFVAIFNYDIKVPLGFWQPVIECFERNSRAAIVGFQEINSGEAELPTSVEFVPAPASLPGMLYICRTNAISQAGLFDESYVMYGEESDLFDKLVAGGWEILQSNIPVWHFVSGSRDRAKWRIAWYSYRNIILHSIRNRSLLGVVRSIAVSAYYAAWIPERPASLTWLGRHFARAKNEFPESNLTFQARIRRFNLGSRGLNLLLWAGAVFWNCLALPPNIARRYRGQLVPRTKS
jgi:GT2 family glycosyltransferase